MAQHPFPAELLYFESIDLLRRRFERHHGRSLSLAKGREIASHFRQGREFHETARGAPLLVKPLLLYYAVLAWTRGLILFRDPIKRESSLRKSHGLSARDWQTTLAAEGTNLGDLKVRFESGTFPELTAATHNVGVFRAGVIRPLLHPGTTELPLGDVVSARDVWARLPELAGVYEETFGEPSYVYQEEDDWGNVTGIRLKPVSMDAALLTPDALRATFGLPEDVEVQPYEWREGPEYTLIPQHSSLSWSGRVWGDDEFILPPFPGDLRLSLLSTMVLNAYVVGMLVRYYPTLWTDLVHRGAGDSSMPLVREATELTESSFPRRLLSALEFPRAT